MPNPYPAGSLFDVIARYGGFLFRPSDFPEADPALGGEVGWCTSRLSALVVLQQKHGWTDRETVRRASMDLSVKASLDMGIEQRGPSQSVLCKHRQRMQALGLDTVYLDRLRDVLEALELVGDDEPVLIDSVPVAGGGQQLDTYNLLAGAIRSGLRELARVEDRPVAEVADELGLSVYLARTIKGRFDVDWQDGESRRSFLAQLVEDALVVRSRLQDANGPASDDDRHDDNDDDTSDGEGDAAASSAAVDIIDKIIDHDIEFAEDGNVKSIRQKRAGDRLISVTDPDMRHGRKSASKLIAGYKAQIVSSLMFGFIVLVRLFKANVHDGRDLPSIAEELRDGGLAPAWWGGDHAYGTLANHQFFASPERGELVARMARPPNGGRHTKDDFDYCFTSKGLHCPGGHQMTQSKWNSRHGRKGRLFLFPATVCGACPLRAQCVNPKASADKGRSVFIVDEDERLIREHLAHRETQGFQERLAQRPAVERVIAGFAQCGGKTTRRRGMEQVAFDKNLSALAYNLRRLGSVMQADPSLGAKLARVLGVFLRRARALFCRLTEVEAVHACVAV